MPRPVKCRRVQFVPQFNYFKPAGIPLINLTEVVLTIEETEALRLRDTEGLEQEECASLMNVSRPTFHRILNSARAKVSDALINGKAIRIEGGNYELCRKSRKCDYNRDHQYATSCKSKLAEERFINNIKGTTPDTPHPRCRGKRKRFLDNT